MKSSMASASKAASGPISTETFNRSTSSCVLVRACAGLPPVSAACSSIGRPASLLLRSLKNVDALLHLKAAGGERAGLDVRKPTRIGPAWA